MSENIGLLLKLILDKVSKNETKQGLNEVAETIEKTTRSVAELTAKEKELAAAIDAQQKKIDAAKNGLDIYASRLEKTKKELEVNPSKTYLEKDVRTDEAGVKRYTDKLAEEEKRLASLRGELQATTDERLDAIDVAERESKVLSELAKHAGMTAREFKKLPQEQQDAARASLDAQKKLEAYNRELAKTEAKINDIRQLGYNIQQMSQGVFLAGAAIVGSIYLAANTEAQRIKEAGGEVDETTKRWMQSQDRIHRAYSRIGKVAMTTLLPFLEKAAELAEKTSKFVEDNPDLVKAALNVGGALAVVGALGMAVAQGLIFASNLMQAANTLKQVTGIGGGLSTAGKAGGGLLSKVGAVGGLAGAGSIAATVATVLAVIAAGAGLGILVYDTIAKLAPKLGLPRFGSVAAGGANVAGQAIEKVAVAGGMDASEAERKTLVLTYLVGRIFGAIKEGDPAWKSVADGAKKAADEAGELGQSVEELAAKEKQAAEILSSLAAENATALRKYNDDVASVNINASRSLADASRQSKKALEDIASNLSKSTTAIRTGLKKGLADRSASYAQANVDAEREYQSQRAEIVAAGVEKVKQIQKELEQLEKNHTQALAGLIDERDALAIYNANKEYEERKAAASESVQQARNETKQQLAEAQRNYDEQRALRAQEFARQQAEMKQQAAEQIAAANAQAAEQRKQVAARLEEQKSEIERGRQEALADLKRNLNIEKRERVLAANEQIKALDGALKAESELKRRYYDVMLADTANFMNAQRSAMKNGSSASPTLASVKGERQIGGYMSHGLYRVHDEEFAVNKPTTKALESLIGGRLSQQALLMAVGGGGGKGVTWNDQRRFYGEISPSQRRIQNEDTARVLLGEMT